MFHGTRKGALFKDTPDIYNLEMTSECTLRVRTYECDSYKHVNNANYLNYLEYARYEYLRDIGFDYEKAIKDGYGVYIARIEIDYKMPAFTDDNLVIKSKPVKKGAVSGTIAQEIWRGDNLLIAAKVTWAFVDSKGQPVKIPAEFDVPGLKP
jgi:acyl-CoA thioester hydrolase